MAKKGQIGTSGFTHVDDATAGIHPSTVEGANHLFYGDAMTPKHELAEVVLGPAPFGSPDPRTLGHQMLPVNTDSGQTPSAPKLDEDFQRVRSHLAGSASSDSLDDMTKDELVNYANQRGIHIDSSMKKNEVRKAIDDASSDSESQGANAGEGQDVRAGASQITQQSTAQAGQASQEGQQGNESTNYQSQNKAELLELANQRNLDVDESNTKAEIVEALENSDNQ